MIFLYCVTDYNCIYREVIFEPYEVTFGACLVIINLENVVFKAWSLSLEVSDNILGQVYYHVFQLKNILAYIFPVVLFLFPVDFYFHCFH